MLKKKIKNRMVTGMSLFSITILSFSTLGTAVTAAEKTYPPHFQTKMVDQDLRHGKVKAAVSIHVTGDDRFYASLYPRSGYFMSYGIDQPIYSKFIQATGKKGYRYTFPVTDMKGRLEVGFSEKGDPGEPVAYLDRARLSGFKTSSKVKNLKAAWVSRDGFFADLSTEGILLQYVDKNGKTLDGNNVFVLSQEQIIGFFDFPAVPKSAAAFKIWTYNKNQRSKRSVTLPVYQDINHNRIDSGVIFEGARKKNQSLRWLSTSLDQRPDFLGYEIHYGDAIQRKGTYPSRIRSKLLATVPIAKTGEYRLSLKKAVTFDSEYDQLYLVAHMKKGRFLVQSFDGKDNVFGEYDNTHEPRPLMVTAFDQTLNPVFPTMDTRTVTVRTYPKDANVYFQTESQTATLVTDKDGVRTYRFPHALKPNDEVMYGVYKDGYASYSNNLIVEESQTVTPYPPVLTKKSRKLISGKGKPNTEVLLVNAKGRCVAEDFIFDKGHFSFTFKKPLPAGRYEVVSHARSVKGKKTTSSVSFKL